MAHEVLISAEQIAARVDELAAELSRDYADVQEIVMIGVLKGAFMFLADLARKMTIPRRIEFISVSSYGEAGDEAGAVRLLMDVRTPLKGKHVLLVEDIVDTGHTIDYLLRILQAREPASLRTCALVQKPDSLEVAVPMDYLGFEIPDVWVVGFGLDFAERDRTLPYIAKLEQPQG
jgi:hypoxanthine phosphoribosyltransferase